MKVSAERPEDLEVFQYDNAVFRPQRRLSASLAHPARRWQVNRLGLPAIDTYFLTSTVEAVGSQSLHGANPKPYIPKRRSLLCFIRLSLRRTLHGLGECRQGISQLFSDARCDNFQIRLP